MRVAPPADLVEVGRAETASEKPGIRGGQIRRRRRRGKPRLHVGAEFAARLGAVFVLQPGPDPERDGGLAGFPADARRMPRLVGEEADDRAVLEEAGETRRVCVVGELDEAADRVRLADVHPAVGGDGLLPAPGAALAREHADLAVAPGGILARDAALAGAARPVVFVVEPHAEAAARSLVAEPLREAQPLLAHVFQREAAARVEKEAARARRLDRGDLGAAFRLGRRPGDGEKRDHARVAAIRLAVCIHRIRNLQEKPLQKHGAQRARRRVTEPHRRRRGRVRRVQGRFYPKAAAASRRRRRRPGPGRPPRPARRRY